MSVVSMGEQPDQATPAQPAPRDEALAADPQVVAPDRKAVAPDRDARRLRNGVLWTAGLATLTLSVGLAVPDLRNVLDRAVHVQLGWLLVALALELGSCLGYVAVVRLVLDRGPKREVRRLAWAEMAFGAVVPLGGAGGLAVGAWAMRAWGISWERVANRSAVIFLLTSGFNAAVLALAGAGILTGIGPGHDGFVSGALPLLAGTGSIAAFLVLPWLTRRRVPWLRARRGWGAAERMAGWVSDTKGVIASGNIRLLGVVAYLLLDIAALWACLRAVGETPSVIALVAGYQIGYLSNLIPIPGAIGVLDGGLLGALVLYGLPAAPTATAVILYHAVALWLPTAGGTAGFVALRRALTSRALSASSPTASAASPSSRRP